MSRSHPKIDPVPDIVEAETSEPKPVVIDPVKDIADRAGQIQGIGNMFKWILGGLGAAFLCGVSVWAGLMRVETVSNADAREARVKQALVEQFKPLSNRVDAHEQAIVDLKKDSYILGNDVSWLKEGMRRQLEHQGIAAPPERPALRQAPISLP